MILRIAFALVLVAALVASGFAAAIIFGTASPPPPLASIRTAARQLEHGLSTLPPVERFHARDGTALALRRYPGQPSRGLAVLIHGSSASSIEMHALAEALSAAGIAAIAIDVRGHGDSGPRGDISHAGQLDEDLADLVRYIEKDDPHESRILIGHSSGGGYVLHVAAGPLACAFKGYIALSPYLNYAAPTVRPGTGGWSRPYIPRIVALSILRQIGITRFEGLPAVAFAVPPGAETTLTRTYSFRLLMDFSLDADWTDAIRRIDRPTRVFVGSRDELFHPDAFAPLFKSLQPRIPVTVIDRVDHMGIVLNGDALKAEVEATARLVADQSVTQCTI